MSLITTRFCRVAQAVDFMAGDEDACKSAAHLLVARLSIYGHLAVTRSHYSVHGVRVYGFIDQATIVRETRAALRDARALWRARNKRTA